MPSIRPTLVAVAPPDGTAVLTLTRLRPDSEEYKLIGRPTGIAFVTEDVAPVHGMEKVGVKFVIHHV